MLKLLGAMLILLAGTLFGFYQASQLSRRPRQIAELIRMLQRLETEIVYGFTPLPDALRRAARADDSPVGALFAAAAEELGKPGGRSVQAVWELMVSRGWKTTSMKAAERDILLHLGSTLGLTDRDDQVKHLRLAVSSLQGEADIARDERERYERMWKSLGLLMGALVVILMY
ncbi:stage III sporulation protein SpoIIIAB [Paenibacillus sp. MZ04-78.2]|uniref:stage III sporulation protein SpoIIIAB n=1 Tax=Paenibacillus sp. MZ04-78.2 TaxID=2962034 RepID=UPI0020B6F4C0|nr:stage III sporulation protein SpoIIIAB [Paenibacillus sp. MZ04-78.2]MCP3773336.1 stage III sporulation protein SpoIIIAB [Paenibacillus sp. MZ04-78.2]